MAKNPTLSDVLQKKNMKLLPAVIAAAVAIYGAKAPKQVPQVDTVHGQTPVTAIYDNKTKLQLVAVEYASIVNAVDRLPKGCDTTVEIAKMISTNAVLRTLVDGKTPGSESGLL